MQNQVKYLGAKLVGIAALAVAAPLLAAVPASAADSSCSSGDFCIWVNEDYSGDGYKLPGNDSWWAGSNNASHSVWDKDSSWKNRYGSWYWACVYDLRDFQNVTVWVSQGQSLRSVPANMYANRGASNHGWYSGDTC